MSRPDPLTAAAADDYDAQHLAEKRAKRLGVAYAPKGVPSTSAPKPPPFTPAASNFQRGGGQKKDKGPAKAPSVLPLFAGDADDGSDDDDDALSATGSEPDNVSDFDELKLKTSLAGKINAYYHEFPHTKPGGESQRKPPVWSSGNDLLQLQGEYERVRGILNSAGGKVAVKAIFSRVMKGLEFVTTDSDAGGLGINPMELNLTGLGVTVENNMHMFEPELTQLSIEYRDYLASGPEWRLAFKAANFIVEYSKLRSNPEYLEKVKAAQEAARQAAAQQRASGANRDL